MCIFNRNEHPMTRTEFLRALALGTLSLPLWSRAMHAMLTDLPRQETRMPALFMGHGNPMNALVNNTFTRAWERTAAQLPRPAAILCISAHWETRGTRVTAMPQPRTIHDFGGFPRALYEMQYPAPGAPALADDTRTLVRTQPVALDQEWGLDHGTWSVLARMYPAADIPVFQLSLDVGLDARGHYDLARQLAPLRDRGVLIMGSGNIVHNLRLADLSDTAPAYDWAVAFDAKAKQLIEEGDHTSLIAYGSLGREAQLSIPTAEHYLPLLYVLAQQDSRDNVSFPVEGMAFRSGSMRAVLLT
jgi:4,5-DOPA dioxygenase extradiol